MTSLVQLKTNLESFLRSTLGVQAWDTIQFSMIPTDAPKGYFQLSEITYGQSTQSLWLVGIGIASLSLSGLDNQIATILEAIEANYYYPQPCINGLGALSIPGSIQIEVPDSYANQSGISQTTGFRTAVTFQLSISFAR